MLCNQGSILLGSTPQSSGPAKSSLGDFLSQYMHKNEPKLQTIQETLKKAETQYHKPQTLTEKALAFQQPVLNNSQESSSRLSNKTSQTLDTSFKNSPDSIATPKGSNMLEVLAEENNKQSKTSKPTAGVRNKSKTLPKTGGEHPLPKTARILTADTGFASPYRSKSPHSNTTSSFMSDSNTAHMSQASSLVDMEPHYNSDEEDLGGFLMIKPIIPIIQNTKLYQPTKALNFNLELNEMLFPHEIIEYAKSLQEANFGAYMRTLIGYLYSFRNQNRLFSTKRPISEAIYSIYFEGETLIMFKKLLFSVIEKLKEESITLKQKYRSEAGYIESRHEKILKSKASTIKFEEKELQKLQSKIANILHEGCLMDSKSAVSQLHHFLERILEKFPSLYRPNPVKLDKNIIIDYITLPKLLERLVESSYSWSDFYQTSVLYTYDLYISAQNLLLYLILRYFEPEPLHMTASELKVYRNEVIKRSKLHVLKIITFWMEERRGDFMRNPEVITILNTFLDLVLPLEKEGEITEALKGLSATHEELSHKIMKHKRKLSDKADLHITHHANSCSGTKPDTSLITRVISATTDSMNSFHAKDEIPTLRQVPSVSDLRAKPFNDLFIPFISKTDSTPNSHSSKLTEPSSNRSRGGQTSPKGSRFGFFAACQTKFKPVYDFNSMFEEDSEKIARYLTAIDSKYFSKIDVSELLNKRWTKNDNKSDCPYYWRYVDRFNSFCSWIQYIVLSQDSLKRRVEITAKFVEVALICLRQYNNHSTSHYIFAAISALNKFDVISMQDQLLTDFDEINKTFILTESFLISYKEICNSMKTPAIPNFNFFLKSFLKLQDGVVFTTKLAESSHQNYLKFPLLVLIHDTCKEMRRFQKAKFEHIRVSKNDELYKFLKREYKRGVPLHLENREETLNKINKMVHQVKEKQNKYYSFFGAKNFGTKNSAF